MGRTQPEEAMAALLEREGILYSEQVQVSGHKIDFIAHFGEKNVLLDVNGDWWHSKPKIIECDRIKLQRVLLGGDAPFAVWYSRIRHHPDSVLQALRRLERSDVPMLPYWDWKVPVGALDPEAREYAKTLLERGAV